MSDEANRPVGITKGPGETIHEYTFISRDERRLLKNGEYVYYELGATPQESAVVTRADRRVLGRIMRRVPVQPCRKCAATCRATSSPGRSVILTRIEW